MQNKIYEAVSGMELPQVKSEHLPYAYGLMVLGAIAVLRSPSRVLSVIGGYMLWNSFIETQKRKLDLHK